MEQSFLENMTSQELEQYNGQNGNPAYIAYKGKIYDITSSKHWPEGTHMDRHIAGFDLTSELEFAPHSENVFKRFPLVGQLIAEEKSSALPEEFRKTVLRNLYHRFHPHPVMIHFPIAGSIFSLIFLAFYLITHDSAFEKGHFVLLIFSFLGGCGAFLSGLLSWWINFDFSKTSIFKTKFYFSLVFLSVSLLLIVTRMYNPLIVITMGKGMIFYALALSVVVAVVLLVAYKGGKITFP